MQMFKKKQRKSEISKRLKYKNRNKIHKNTENSLQR